MAERQQTTRETSRLMQDHLMNWCEAHNIELCRSTLGVQATAYKHNGEPIDTVVITHRVDVLPEQKEDIMRALKACDAIAERLMILKPSMAMALNSTCEEIDE